MAKTVKTAEGTKGTTAAKKETKAKFAVTIGEEIKPQVVTEPVAVELVEEEKPAVTQKEIKTPKQPTKLSSLESLGDFVATDVTNESVTIKDNTNHELVAGPHDNGTVGLGKGVKSDYDVDKAAITKPSKLPVEESKGKPTIPAKVANVQRKTNVNQYHSNTAKHSDNVARDRNGRPLPPEYVNVPPHVAQMALLIKNNAEIRRYTSLAILNYLLQKGLISGEKRYVEFCPDKFVVKADGMRQEYRFTQPFFINALVSSFNSFAASATATISHFIKNEPSMDPNSVGDDAEVQFMVNASQGS